MCDALYVREGAIMKAKPKHFIPRPEGVGSIGQHPVIVLTVPDPNGYVLVTPMSHNHPEGTPTRCASYYGLPVDPVKGESRVNVGAPKLIHLTNLRANNPHTSMTMKDYMALKNEISAHWNPSHFNMMPVQRQCQPPQQHAYYPAHPGMPVNVSHGHGHGYYHG